MIEVWQKYSLTIDREATNALDGVLRDCTSTELVLAPRGDTSEATGTADDAHPLALWDDSGNGRITCRKAGRHGIASVREGHPAFIYMRDHDGDGVPDR